MDVRRAAFAGSWYPESARECEAEIRRFIADADLAQKAYVGGIVPHAGWYFSGEIACRVVYGLSRQPHPDAVVLFGMHLHPESPNYIMMEGAWETPFGDLAIETNLAGRLAARFDFQLESARRHTQDNTIELQLPFIKYFFPDTKIVPLGVPPKERSLKIGAAVAEAAEELGLGIKIIGSTDLTHYGPNYGFSPRGQGAQALDWMKKQNDRRMVDAMLSLDAETVIREGLAHQNACCAGAVAAAIAAVSRLGAQSAEEVAYATSYDKHPGDSFVGYVGVLFKQ